MGRFSPTVVHHWIRCRLNYRGEREWTCVSEWDVYYANSRQRWLRSRRTTYRNEKDAKRWARRYKVDCPTEPEPPRETKP